MMGAALGPVFSSCSPTYFVILATVLPQSFGVGLVYLGVYAAGLSIILLLISYLGQKFVKKVEWASNPNGIFKRGLGVVFILVGIFIITGFDKKIQTFILDKGYFNSTKIEDQLLNIYFFSLFVTFQSKNI
jgi:sulfite exporter TauE/SafE